VRNKELTLEKLIEGCIKKDFRSEELLYKTYFGYLSGVAYRYTKERNESVELINDSFVRIFKKLDTFAFNGPPDEKQKAFKGWIGRITANVAIDRIRAKKAIVYLEDITNETKADMAIEAPDRLSYNDITMLIGRLPDIQQLIFNMHEIEGFSHEEIAVKLRIPASTSRVYLTRSKTKLASLYNNLMKTHDEK
jgi:RNA polymerase sigma factor (sigma-70 family)